MSRYVILSQELFQNFLRIKSSSLIIWRFEWKRKKYIRYELFIQNHMAAQCKHNDEMRIKEPRRRDSPSHPQLKSASWPHTGAGCLKETTQMGVRSKTGGWSHSKPSLSRSWAPRRPRPPPPSHVSGDTVEKSARLLEIPILSCARSHFRNDCINWA